MIKRHLTQVTKFGAMLSAMAFLSGSWLTGAPVSFKQWIGQYQIPADQQGADDNPAGDGISNLVKYALGLNPEVASRDGIPAASMVDGKLTLTFAKNPDATGIEYIVEASSDLVNWSSEGLNVTNSSNESYTVADSSGDSPRFLRLRIPVPEDRRQPDAFLYVVGGRTLPVAQAKNWDPELDRADTIATYVADVGAIDARSILIADIYADDLEVTNWRRASNYLQDRHPEDPLGSLHWTYLQNQVHHHNGRLYVGPGDYNGESGNRADGVTLESADFVTWAEIDPQTGDLGEFAVSPRLPLEMTIGATAIVEVNGDYYYYVIGGSAGGLRRTNIFYGKIDPVTGAIDSWAETEMGLNEQDYFNAAVGYNGYLHYTTGVESTGWMLQSIQPIQEDEDGWRFKGSLDWSIEGGWQEIRYADEAEMPGNRWDHAVVVGEVDDEAYIYAIGGARTGHNPTDVVNGISLNPDGTVGQIVEVDPIPARRRRLAAAAYKDIIIQTGGSSTSSYAQSQDNVFIGRVQKGGNIEWKTSPEPMWQYRSFHGSAIAPAAQD